eukprot:TRINITY_DN5180_c0_g2_i11.p1 TRINITY_DN5180_c0_g2~~TRINITY_DN5180_c0_g2_i11.p1  ORF type:complete len:473 (-),score=105.36 TRINITY_DN5180_c0_g2_i11:371-1789(-)
MQLVILSCPKVHYSPSILPSTPPSTDFYSKRASSSYFVNWFCISNKRLSGSLSSYRRVSNLDGYCFVKGASEISSFGIGFCNLSKRISESVGVCKSHRNLSSIRCEGVFVEERDDEFYMRRCVELAKKAVGCTSPNPMVGCVIVKNGEIVGEGFHPKAGQPHAEVFALNDAGTHAENATAYVSLEPCNHYGRTPPCTEAMIRAKVKHVVVGMVDPNPIVASKGVERLRGAGIEVTVGVEEELCRKLNEAYIHRMLTGKPFVALRYLSSFNGRILNQVNDEDEESSGYYLQLLQEHDGVVISSTSMASDSKALAFNKTSAKQPLLIIIATVSDSPLHLPALTAEVAPRAIIFADKNVTVDPATESNLRRWGTEIVVWDQMNLGPILDYCGGQGLCSILIDLKEDSSAYHEILKMGLEEGLLQKVVMEICPLWAGSKEGSCMRFSSVGRKSVGLKDLQSRILKGGNVLVEGYLC